MGTCNRCDQVQRSVDAALAGDSGTHRLIVIDAGSTDGTLAALRQRVDLTLVEDGQKLGQALSLNRVARTIETPYLSWISDDNVLKPEALRTAIRILDKDPSIGMVSLKVRDVEGSKVQKPYIGAISAAGFINCNQGVVRTALFKQVGGFDEGFADYMMDTDFTAKILLLGKAVVFTKDVAIEHYRDHESDSWIGAEARKARLESRRILFEQRYSALIDRVEQTQKRGFLEDRLRKVGVQRKLQTMLKRYNLVRYAWNDRDWHNLAFASTLSVSDPLRHLFAPHYLRQSLPSGLSMNPRSSLASHTTTNPRRAIHVKRWELASQLESARKRADIRAVAILRRSLDEIDQSLSLSRS